MTIDILDRPPLAAFRRSVLGFLIGAGLGVGFIVLVLALDVGELVLQAMRAGDPTILDLALLPVTFGLLGLVVGPSVGGGATS